MKKSEKVNDIEKIYDAVNNEIADDELDCVAGGSGADNMPPSKLEIRDNVMSNSIRGIQYSTLEK